MHGGEQWGSMQSAHRCVSGRKGLHETPGATGVPEKRWTPALALAPKFVCRRQVERQVHKYLFGFLANSPNTNRL